MNGKFQTEDCNLQIANRGTPRAGVTLSEVLVSMLIMSIGVVSLATMFPLSVVRSVEATQLTSGTILRKNAEMMWDYYPPTDPRNPFTSINVPQFAGTPSTRLAVIDPYGFFLHELGSCFGANKMPGNGNASTLIPALGLVANNGWCYVPGTPPRALGAPDYTQIFSGDDPAHAVFAKDSAGNNIIRYPGGIASLDLEVDTNGNGIVDGAEDLNGNGILDLGLDALFSLPDNWTVLFEGVPTSQTPTTSPTSAVVDGLGSAGVSVSSTVATRVLLQDSETRQIQTRPLTATSINTSADSVTWATALPSSFGTISNLKIEAQTRRYTWMSTFRVRWSPFDTIPFKYDRWSLVIFYNRAFDAEDEFIYGFTPPSGSTKTGVFDQGSPTIIIDVPAQGTSNPNGYKPTVKNGGWVLDSMNLLWYRVQSHTNLDTSPVTITLDRAAALDSNQAMFMKGVVEVYNLPPRSR